MLNIISFAVSSFIEVLFSINKASCFAVRVFSECRPNRGRRFSTGLVAENISETNNRFCQLLLLKRLFSKNTNTSRFGIKRKRLKAYSHQAKVGVKAKKTKEYTTNIKGNFRLLSSLPLSLNTALRLVYTEQKQRRKRIFSSIYVTAQCEH